VLLYPDAETYLELMSRSLLEASVDGCRIVKAAIDTLPQADTIDYGLHIFICSCIVRLVIFAVGLVRNGIDYPKVPLA
jgi:hypothetical protein